MLALHVSPLVTSTAWTLLTAFMDFSCAPSYVRHSEVYHQSILCLVAQGSLTIATADGVSGETMHAQALESRRPCEQPSVQGRPGAHEESGHAGL